MDTNNRRIKTEIELEIQRFSSRQEVRDFYKLLQDEKSVWKQEKMFSYVQAVEGLMNKYIQISIKSHVNAMFMMSVMENHERGLKLVDEAIGIYNDSVDEHNSKVDEEGGDDATL